MNDVILDVKDLHIQYNDNAVLAIRGVSFILRRGEILIIKGENGSGKSTLLRSIIKLFPKGVIKDARGRLECKVSKNIVLQRPKSQILTFKVSEEITSSLSFKKISRPERKNRLQKLLIEFDKLSLEEKDPRELSSGQQQSVVILSSIINEEELLLMDEPFSLLDHDNSRILLKMLHQLNKKGHSLIIVDHNPEKYLGLADKLLVLKAGELEYYGDFKEGIGEYDHLEKPKKFGDHVKIIHSTDSDALDVSGFDYNLIVGYSKPLFQVAFNMDNGITLVRGPNASGKTALLKTISGIIPAISSEKPIKKTFYYLPQDSLNFFWKRTVREELGDCPYPSWLEPFLDRSPFNLSDGERKIISIIMGLHFADMIVIDEPSQSLDQVNRSWLIAELKRLSGEKTFIIASNDPLFITGILPHIRQIIEV